MKALVVGGAGFIGSHLCEALLADKNEVVCVDDLSLGNKEYIKEFYSESNFKLYKVDVAVCEDLEVVIQKTVPDIIYHLAANSDIQASAANPYIEYKNTYTTTYNILFCMRKYNIKKLFFASTSAVYGDKRDIVLDEETPNLSPISYYGAAKLGSEALISAFSYMNNIQALIFRFPNVIGPRLTHGVIFDFINKLETDSTQLNILGNGKQDKPYIYISDLINAIMQFSTEMNVPGMSIYNLGVSGSTTVKSIADMLCEEMELTNVKYLYMGGESGWKGDVPRFQYNIEKIHKAGWKAEYTSDEAVRKTIHEVLEERKRSAC